LAGLRQLAKRVCLTSAQRRASLGYFPDTMGIVYTPPEIVDFMCACNWLGR
jgi:hypothetical protein